MCKVQSCAFTGHRNVPENFDLQFFNKVVESFIKEGITVFYSGMATGFDLIAAEQVIELRKKYGHVKLVACVPCLGQQKYYSESEKRKYEKILPLCDEVKILSDHYYNGCMLVRDRYMVDNCGTVIALLEKNDGGTAYTVRYALEKGRKVNFI